MIRPYLYWWLCTCLLSPCITYALDTVAFEIPENSPADTVVGSLIRRGVLTYSAIGTSTHFSVNPSTGLVTLVKSPDREVKQHHKITVRMEYDVTLPNVPLTPQIIEVTIRILDVNDHSPSFVQKSTDVVIKESQLPGWRLPVSPAEDPDLGENSTQSYRLLHTDPHFKLDQYRLDYDDVISCELILVTSFDREKLDSHVVTIIASDGGSPPRTDTHVINIQIADVNDNTPTFNQSVYQTEVLESAAPGRVLITVLARDDDAGDNADITYFIEPRSNKNGLFSMDPKTGELRLAGSLDRETGERHDLQVVATDRGRYPLKSTARVSIKVLDVNDFIPEISVSFLSQDDMFGVVAENSKLGTFVAHVNVLDQDLGVNAEVELKLHGADELPFTVEEVSSGLFAIQVAGELDRERRSTWDMWLEARDNPRGASMSQISHVSYYNFTVNIVDVNDCPPVFSSQVYRCNVSEIAEAGIEILKVSAEDGDMGVNAKISYYIVSVKGIDETGNVSDTIKFSINSNTGMITTRSQLDREGRKGVELTIEARDHGQPSLSARCTVIIEIIDYNDNDPKFTQRHYSTVVPENTPVGSVIMHVTARDKDNGGKSPVTYFIKEYFSSSTSIFSVNETSGEIRTLSEIDYEKQPVYNLVVEAVDMGGRRGVASVEIHVLDKNDEKPKFNQESYVASILHTVLPGTPVTRVDAFDEDSGENGRVEYRIVQGGEKFSIDRYTGTIKTLITFQGILNGTEKVLVQAYDQGTPRRSTICTVTVTIGSLSIIDRRPVFVNQVYEVDVAEDTLPRHVVAVVRAESQDKFYTGEIKYSLSQLTPLTHKLFTIESETGRLILKSTLDREEEEKYNIIIEATDSLGRQALTSIIINVIDSNDNIPQFTSPHYHFSVPEDLKVGRTAAKIHAYDIDFGINGLVQYACLGADDLLPFALDTHTGVLSVSQELDFELETTFMFTVRVFNKASPSMYQDAAVKISVTDVNDNAPQFIRSSFNFDVLDSSLQDVTVGLVLATDKDSGFNGELFYTLSPDSDMFRIDLYTGELKTGKVFANTHLQPSYHLRVLCRDRGNPSLNATVKVTVSVRSSGDIVNTLEKVLANDALSRKAKYLIVFFAIAFLLTTFVLVCFVWYHRKDKKRYRRLPPTDTKPLSPKPVRAGLPQQHQHQQPIRSTENLLKSRGGSCDTLSTIAQNRMQNVYPAGGNTGPHKFAHKFTDHDMLAVRGSGGNSEPQIAYRNGGNVYKEVEYGCYHPSRDVLSRSFFEENKLDSMTRAKVLDDESRDEDSLPRDASTNTCFNHHRTPSRSDVASSYELSPGIPRHHHVNTRAQQTATDSNSDCNQIDSGLSSSESKIPPKTNLDGHPRSWMSSHNSIDSLFRLKNPLKSFSDSNKLRQVRFKQLNDSFV